MKGNEGMKRGGSTSFVIAKSVRSVEKLLGVLPVRQWRFCEVSQSNVPQFLIYDVDRKLGEDDVLEIEKAKFEPAIKQ